MGDGRTTHLGQTRPIDNVRNKSQFAPDGPELARDTTDERATVAFRLRQAPMPSAALGEFDFITAGRWALIERPRALHTAARTTPPPPSAPAAAVGRAPPRRPS